MQLLTVSQTDFLIMILFLESVFGPRALVIPLLKKSKSGELVHMSTNDPFFLKNQKAYFYVSKNYENESGHSK
jgi:hypothetical protein